MIDISRSVGDSDDLRGTHDPAIRDQSAHQKRLRGGLAPALQNVIGTTDRCRVMPPFAS
jgi:hypothetical protein